MGTEVFHPIQTFKAVLVESEFPLKSIFDLRGVKFLLIGILGNVDLIKLFCAYNKVLNDVGHTLLGVAMLSICFKYKHALKILLTAVVIYFKMAPRRWQRISDGVFDGLPKLLLKVPVV